MMSPGPPPHARGSPSQHGRFTDLARPTPACAGITGPRRRRRRSRPAHPRMRGDHSWASATSLAVRGPPPHARGSRRGRGRRRSRRRPTPACAGITRSPVGRGLPNPAHPRMRGDHPAGGRSPRRSPGPPPHARGSPMMRETHSWGRRPTPACAGITAFDPPGPASYEAHPRMRGDHAPCEVERLSATGPPPHARGSPVSYWGRLDSKRPTPACAGITLRP